MPGRARGWSLTGFVITEFIINGFIINGFIIIGFIICCAGDARAASLFDPALRFRMLRTTHFRIYFHQGADVLAARLAVIAEDAWGRLERTLGTRPPRTTHVVIADQTELPNAYATPLPYDTIVIYPTWPPGSDFDTDDWLRLVFTHEFTHIVHLDRSESWARVVRNMFGRTPLAFPNLFLPTWQIEGLATYAESALTGEGRLHAGEFRALVDEAARARALQPLDRVNGGLTDWPSGQAPYAYGSAFHAYLAERYGVETLGTLADRTARRVPYTGSRVFPSVFGKSLGELWRDFEQARMAEAGAPRSSPAVTQLTHDGFVAAGPRFDRACDDCAPGIVYSRRNADAFPSLDRIDLRGGTATRLATRYFGSTVGIGRRAVYFDQLEAARNVALLGDLYRLSRDSGRVDRLTSGARLHDPDLSPDESTIVAVQEHTGRRDLVIVGVGDMAVSVVISEPDAQFNAPRWSPDGRRVAVERHRLGFDPEIVVVDVATKVVDVVAAREGVRIVRPAWRPDGRAIVAAAAPDDRVFNVIEFPLDGSGSPRQLTDLSGGATWPDVSADGNMLAFVGYTVAGFDIFTMPYPTDAPLWPDARLTRPPKLEQRRKPSRPDQITPDLERSATASASAAPSSSYSPWPTVRPTWWFPIVEANSDQTRVGAFTAGADVLGYHLWTASATWLASGPDGAPRPAGPDWTVAYAYDRWRPTLIASASSDTTFFAGPATDAGTPSAATRREHEFEGGVFFPVVRARWSQAALATVLRSTDDFILPDRTLSRERTGFRAAWRTMTAKEYGYSISLEDGLSAGVTTELIREAWGASADATTTTADLRAYVPGFARHHVLAIRGAAGVSSGDPISGRTFLLGGVGPNIFVNDFGSEAISLLRGFAADSFGGSRVALVNAEYRWPLARPQRGVGTWPLFLHTLHAAAFVDAGHAWTRSFDASAIKTSVGAELSANVVFSFFVPLTVSAGIARGHDGSGTIQDGFRTYLRLGKSF